MELEIGKRITSLRKIKGITQLQLANYLGVLPQTVSRWETENGIPDVYLLPKIANFFSISLDDLFGLTDMKKIEDLVCKYSVLRDEASYEEALAAITLQETNLVINENSNDIQAKLLGEKMHLYLQRTRQDLSDTIMICKELIKLTDNTDSKYHIIGLLQLQQLECMANNDREMLIESKERYYSSKNRENLLLYLNALIVSKNYDELFLFFEKEFKNTEYYEINNDSYELWSFFMETASSIDNLEFINTYLPSYEKICTKGDLFLLKFNLEKNKRLKDISYTPNKEALYTLLNETTMNEYFKVHFNKEIEEL
ncbi:MAG: helix-turn-helix transcriptional regulator [Erysipelotrichales bacterium]|nr:helix-turn-helix transcriptional regulator [Erysipelotrichales bacterium]